MANNIRDNAFDVDPFVLADLPFAAYYPFASGTASLIHVATGGLLIGGSADVEFVSVGVPTGGIFRLFPQAPTGRRLPRVYTYDGDVLVLVSGAAETARGYYIPALHDWLDEVIAKFPRVYDGAPARASASLEVAATSSIYIARAERIEQDDDELVACGVL